MRYLVEIDKTFNALQGLSSPIRATKNLPSLQPAGGYQIALKIGVVFEETQLTERGWFMDTDAIDAELEAMSLHLSSKKWTELFEFRPTFELVARWVYGQLGLSINQLEHVTLTNQTLGVTTRYTK